MDATKSQFNETMKREGRTITCHGNEIKCFFRKNPEEMSIRDSIILYYDKNAAIDCGNIYQYRDCNYLIMNKETAENDIYCKSHAVRCNGFIRNLTTEMEKTYIYCSGLLNTLAAQDTFLSIIDGNAVFQTEANEESRKAQINDKFNQFGRSWQIQNIYEIDGILHLSCQIVEDVEEVYMLGHLVEFQEEYYLGATVDLTHKLYINGILCDDAQIRYAYVGNSNNTFSWNTSTKGRTKVVLTAITNYKFKVIATCDNVTISKDIIFKTIERNTAVTATIIGDSEAYAGISTTYNLSVTQGTTDITNKVSDITWAFVGDSYKSKLTPVSDNPAQAVLVADSSSAVGKTLTIKATAIYNGNSISATKEVIAKGLF